MATIDVDALRETCANVTARPCRPAFGRPWPIWESWTLSMAASCARERAEAMGIDLQRFVVG